jgi:hypothetical protein
MRSTRFAESPLLGANPRGIDDYLSLLQSVDQTVLEARASADRATSAAIAAELAAEESNAGLTAVNSSPGRLRASPMLARIEDLLVQLRGPTAQKFCPKHPESQTL